MPAKKGNLNAAKPDSDKDSHPTRNPCWILAKRTGNYPGLTSLVETLVLAKGSKELGDWPSWCFLPVAGWYSIVSARFNVPRLKLHHVSEVPIMAALGTWRYSQGIYKVDETLYRMLSHTGISGDIPAEVLTRLPEWCVYIEAPNGAELFGQSLFGFWAHLEHDMNNGRSELRLLLNLFEQGLHPFILHLDEGSLERCLKASFEESRRQAQVAGLEFETDPDSKLISEEITPLISILLYLCSDHPEIDGRIFSRKNLAAPIPKKTKKGMRIFPPSGPTRHIVGERIGHQIRQASEGGSYRAPGKGKRTHIRRGHWHGYWTGPLNGNRKFGYKWIAPILIASSSSEMDSR